MKERERFYGHLDPLLKRARTLGVSVRVVGPDACTPQQIGAMRAIIVLRKASAAVAFMLNGILTMAYDDPRFPSSVSYLYWDGFKWATPEGPVLETIRKIDPVD